MVPGRGENVSHAPGGTVGSEVRVPLRVLVRNADPELGPIVHLNLPVMSASHWDQIPQDGHTPAHTHSIILHIFTHN